MKRVIPVYVFSNVFCLLLLYYVGISKTTISVVDKQPNHSGWGLRWWDAQLHFSESVEYRLPLLARNVAQCCTLCTPLHISWNDSVSFRWRYLFHSGTDMNTCPSSCDTWFQYYRTRDCSLPFISLSRYAHASPQSLAQNKITHVHVCFSGGVKICVLHAFPVSSWAQSHLTEQCCLTWATRRP